jgi:hypothetical protein
MVVPGDNERNTVLDEQPVKAIPSLLIPVETVMEDDRKKRFMEKHKLVTEWSLQFLLQPGQLLPLMSLFPGARCSVMSGPLISKNVPQM